MEILIGVVVLCLYVWLFPKAIAYDRGRYGRERMRREASPDYGPPCPPKIREWVDRCRRVEVAQRREAERRQRTSPQARKFL